MVLRLSGGFDCPKGPPRRSGCRRPDGGSRTWDRRGSRAAVLLPTEVLKESPGGGRQVACAQAGLTPMSPAEIRPPLRDLKLERLEAALTGLADNSAYMADLESEDRQQRLHGGPRVR